MRSFVLKGVSVVTAVILSCSSVYAECRCTCKPDPPGGTTRCASGIAVCGKGPTGCEGLCVGVNGTTSLEVAASALSGVLGGTITVQDLRRNADQARGAISSLLSSNSTDEVTVAFDGNSVTGTFGISGEVAPRLRDAVDALERGVNVLEGLPEILRSATPSELERLRREAEKIREDLEKQRRSREIDINTYKEGIDEYKEKIEQYKEAYKQKDQEPPDTTDQ
jgi:hypothetical protein